MPASPVLVTIATDRFKTDITAGGHALTADEPAALGGADAGPNPYELLLAAVGACKTITLRMYADRKGWPLERAAVALRHDRRHADDCERCDESELKIDHIDAELTLEGELSDEQRDRLREIADRCPVHRTVTGELRVKTVLAG